MSRVLLETDRLALMTWDENGADEMYALHADPAVNRFMASYDQDWSRDKAEARVAQWRDEHARFGLGKHRVIRRADGTFIGRAGFSLFGDRPPELGYSLGSAHWGQGYAGEMAAALRDWFFATRTDPAFIGYAHRDNAASRRVLEKIGMRATYEEDVADAPHQFYILERT